MPCPTFVAPSAFTSFLSFQENSYLIIKTPLGSLCIPLVADEFLRSKQLWGCNMPAEMSCHEEGRVIREIGQPQKGHDLEL
jgi:hypothetical protein